MRYPEFIKRTLSLLLGLILFTLLFYFGGLSSFKKVKEINFTFTFLAFICTFAVIFLVTLRWKNILRVLAGNAEIKKNDLFRYFLVSKLIGSFIPKDISDFAVRGLSLNYSGKANIVNAFQSVLIDRLFDVFILMTSIIPALLFFVFYPELNNSLLLYLLLTALFLGTLKINPLKLVEVLLFKILKIKLISKFENLRNFSKNLFINFNYSISFMLITLSALKFLTDVLFLLFLSKALNIRIPLEVLFWGSSIGQLFFLIGITPGALGILEMGWFGILMIAGIGRPDIVYFITMRRICSIAFMATLLFISYAIKLLEKNVSAPIKYTDLG